MPTVRDAVAAYVVATALVACSDPSAPPPERGTHIFFTVRTPCSDGRGTCDAPFSLDPDSAVPPARVEGVDPNVQERFAWSRDGQRFAFLQDGALRVATVGAVDTQTVVPSGVARYDAIRWSPDGTRLSYVRDDGLCAVTSSGASLRCFGTGASHYRSVGFTPDGGSLIGVQDTVVATPGGFQIVQLGTFRLSLATGGRTRVAVDREVGSAASSPASLTMAFASWESGITRLFVMSLAGGPTRRLTRSQELTDEWQPVFSPDGRRVAFAGTAGSWSPSPEGRIAAADVWVVNVDGTELRRLTTSGGAVPVAWVR